MVSSISLMEKELFEVTESERDKSEQSQMSRMKDRDILFPEKGYGVFHFKKITKVFVKYCRLLFLLKNLESELCTMGNGVPRPKRSHTLHSDTSSSSSIIIDYTKSAPLIPLTSSMVGGSQGS